MRQVYVCRDCGVGSSLVWADSYLPFCSECGIELEDESIDTLTLPEENPAASQANEALKIQVEKRQLSVHTNVIWDFIFKQHHSIGTALCELVQNAYDADAKNIWLDIDHTGFTCKDDGKGFREKREITDWFEVFGAPRDEESERKFGRFRMGRGQIMGLASTSWRSGTFEMKVDPKNHGLDYDLYEGLPSHQGCTINGRWYEALNLDRTHSRLIRDQAVYNQTVYSVLKEELKESIKYIFATNIYLNGKRINLDPDSIDWTIETEDFYFLRDDSRLRFSRNKVVKIYNLGIYLGSFGRLKDEGILVTKKHMKLNMTRSKVQHDCPVMEAITHRLRQRKYSFSTSKKYPYYVAYEILHAYVAGDYSLSEIMNIKLIHDLHSRKVLTLRELTGMDFTIPIGVNQSSADFVDQIGKYLVIKSPQLDIFSNQDTPTKLPQLFDQIHNDNPEFAERLLSRWHSISSILESADQTKVILPDEKVSKKERQILEALNKIGLRYPRKVVLGVSQSAIGWTDGHSFIAIERNWLKDLGTGLGMAMKLANLLIHEYSHNAHDTEGHDGAFYKRHHDLTDRLHEYLTTEFLRAYDDILARDKSKTTMKMKLAIQAVRRGGKSKI